MLRRGRDTAALLLRALTEERAADALRAFGRCAPDALVPPHALWRLGRWALVNVGPKAALAPLARFLRDYPGHLDRPRVLRDYARCLAGVGKRREAHRAAQEAELLGLKAQERQRADLERQQMLSGRAQQAHLNRELETAAKSG